MTRGNVRRLGAAALVLGCLIALPGQAGADDDQKLSIAGPATITEGGTATYTIRLTDGTDDTATVKVDAAPAGSTSTSDISFTPATLTVPEGATGVNFTVQATPDGADELNEPFTVTLSDSVRATIETASVTTDIVDDDTPTLVISDATADEGAAAVFTISLSQAAASAVTVRYATANGTAVEPGDYAAEAPTTPVTFAPGDTSETIDIQTNDETPALDENNETFTVVLSNASSNAAIGDGTGLGTITDDDDPPIVKIAKAPDVTEGGVAHFPVTLDRPSGRAVNVTYRTVNGTAHAGTDFNGTPGSSVEIAAGALTGDIAIQTIETLNAGQRVPEEDETFSVALIANATLRLAPPDDEAAAKIVDDELAASPTINGPSVFEGNPVTPENPGLTDLVFEVSLQGPHPKTTFNYRTVAETANGTDFVEVGGSQITLEANSNNSVTKQPLTIKVRRDLTDENDETLKVELLKPDATEAKVAEGTGTIKNDDNNSKLSISDASADEPGTMTFTVTLSPASGRVVTVNWATAAGTATEGADYTAGSGGVTFAPGEGSKTIDVAVAGDSLDEANETLTVNLSSPTGVPAANVLDGQGAGTIVDKNAPPSLSITDAIAREGAGATFTVSLAGTTLQEVKVNFSTADGSAKAGSDYAPRSGTLTFAAGEKSKTIAVTITDDTQSEPVEEFFVQLGDPVSAAITKSRGQGSIEASDRSDTPVTDPTKPPVGKPASVLVPRMILGPRTVAIGANGIARMLVTCQKLSPIGCAGTVELERAVKPLLKLGKKTFTVKKGAKGYASVKLSAKTLKLLRKNGTMRAKVIVLVKTSTKTIKVSPGIITLKATKALLKPKAKSKPKPKPPSTQVVVDP